MKNLFYVCEFEFYGWDILTDIHDFSRVKTIHYNGTELECCKWLDTMIFHKNPHFEKNYYKRLWDIENEKIKAEISKSNKSSYNNKSNNQGYQNNNNQKYYKRDRDDDTMNIVNDWINNSSSNDDSSSSNSNNDSWNSSSSSDSYSSSSSDW